MQEHQLIKLANFKMPFGKYKDQYLLFIPEQYIIWLINSGTLNTNLKDKLLFIKEIKDNGLEHLLLPLIKKGNP
jgi:uncharacterized protein (DUF3820 family)